MTSRSKWRSFVLATGCFADLSRSRPLTFLEVPARPSQFLLPQPNTSDSEPLCSSEVPWTFSPGALHSKVGRVNHILSWTPVSLCWIPQVVSLFCPWEQRNVFKDRFAYLIKRFKVSFALPRLSKEQKNPEKAGRSREERKAKASEVPKVRQS